jgi:hypothetical protein
VLPESLLNEVIEVTVSLATNIKESFSILLSSSFCGSIASPMFAASAASQSSVHFDTKVGRFISEATALFLISFK